MSHILSRTKISALIWEACNRISTHSTARRRHNSDAHFEGMRSAPVRTARPKASSPESRHAPNSDDPSKRASQREPYEWLAPEGNGESDSRNWRLAVARRTRLPMSALTFKLRAAGLNWENGSVAQGVGKEHANASHLRWPAGDAWLPQNQAPATGNNLYPRLTFPIHLCRGSQSTLQTVLPSLVRFDNQADVLRLSLYRDRRVPATHDRTCFRWRLQR